MIEYYEAFLDYFMGLNLSGQILTGILIIIGLVAVGYIIYGTIWITYQSIKFSIVLTIIIIYLGIALVTIIISLIADEKNAGTLWSKTSHDIQKIISSTYNFDKSQVDHDIPIDIKPNNPSPPVIIIKKPKLLENSPIIAEDLYEERDLKTNYVASVNEDIERDSSKKIINTNIRQEFCPNCGSKFTSKMLNVLNEMSFTFCELCGEKFYRREKSQETSV